ncbi:motility associated factor glycosyltransferase family protein [Clostridium cochlearium]|uniref:Motility associated factor glycosyltransferase family protein n=1 Tax=Clostridium cochlearium TaxID=1494 RepID=A0A7Y3XYY9_CLOCO|nr:6-hydroxymethylpterin diphosphokinase MptE-like protein [Clostridium cochlearium]NOH16435.1 motility associated factor glycosyltransferase family protein [Clostridium cochlearium]
MDIFTEKTLEVLKKVKDIDKEYSLEKSKDGKYIIRINKEGKKIYLGSKYNVQRDIDNFLESLEDINPSSIIVVFGLASGEHIKELLSKLEESNKVLIIEPDVNVLNKFLQVQYAEDIVNDDRISLCLYKKDEIQSFFSNIIDIVSVKNNIKFKIFSNYDKVYSEELLHTFDDLKKIMENSLMDNSTTKYFSQTFTKAIINNLKHIVRATPINYFENQFQGKSAIVVSAGPSLEENVCKLKKVQDNFIIITGARSLGTLIKNNIIPDFICMVDPGDVNCKFIESYLKYKIPLIFFEKTSYKAMNLYSGPKILFSGNPVTSIILEQNIDGLLAGGSVAHTCTAFASYIGCNPITFIGQDFAYTGEKLHSDSSVFEEDNNIDKKRDTIEVEDIFGNIVKTDRKLNIYRINMEEIIKNYKDKIFINSTEGGANMKGTIVQPLSKTIEEYGKEKIEKQKIQHILNHPPIIKKEKIVKYLEESEKILKKIHKKSEIALNYSNDIYLAFTQNKNINVNNINKKLDKIDDYIKENREKMILINSLLFEVIENVLCNPKYMLTSKDSEREKGIKIAEKSRTLYKGIKDKIKEFMPILKQGIESLKEDNV